MRRTVLIEPLSPISIEPRLFRLSGEALRLMKNNTSGRKKINFFFNYFVNTIIKL